MEYGYCRISTKKQSLERQIQNIQSAFPNADIRCEEYTGTKLEGRKVLDTILKLIKSGDKIIFDSVSRMSRNAEEGYTLYQELYNKGIELIFLKEPYINTSTYKSSLEKSVPMTGTSVDFILDGVNKYLMLLAQEQIKIAFNQSEKEVKDLRKRTSEGVRIAKVNGKQVGAIQGKKLVTKKSIQCKKKILELSRSFKGTNSDEEVMKILGISRNTYYKYKKEIANELLK